MKKSFWMAVVVLLGQLGCQNQEGRQTETKVTRLGRIGFVIEQFDMSLYNEFAGSDGNPYYARFASLRNGVDLEIQLQPVEVMPMAQRSCKISKTLSSVERDSLISWTREVEICNYEIPPGTAIPLSMAIPSGMLKGYGQNVLVSNHYAQGIAFCSSAQTSEFISRVLSISGASIVCTSVGQP